MQWPPWSVCSIALIALISLSPQASTACPTHVKKLCTCVDELDGVLLNCSNTNPMQLLQVLKASQAELGLLKLLSIHNSPLQVLPANFFSGLYIKRLELSEMNLQLVESQAFAGLEPVLQELNLRGNQLKTLPIQAISGLTSLLRLDFSGNEIEELKAEDALPRFPKLYEIELSRNRIASVHKSFFDNVKGSLQTINLGHNQLAEVPAPALRGFRQLMALHLHNNQLRHIAAMSFMNLPVLSLLNLAANKIQSIHRQAFLNVPQLRFLYLTDNELAELQPRQFASFEQLEMVDLSNNRLRVIRNDTFPNLSALKQLYLGENRIADIEDFAFANCSVVVLILEGNQLEEVRKEMFSGAGRLQQLSLKDNHVKSVDPNAFYNNPALVMADLSRNQIIDVAPATFLSQLNMLLVDLSHNRMLRVPYSAFNRRVVTVLLQENPLVCSEKVHMLQQGVGVFIPNSEDLICRGQRALTPGTTIASLEATEHDRGAPGGSSSPNLLPSTTSASHEEHKNPFLQITPPSNNPLQTRIRPISQGGGGPRAGGVKKIQTSRINQFVDQSQFPTEEGAHESTTVNEPSVTSLDPSEISTTVMSTGGLSAATTTTTENSRVIYPLPVPFLSRPTKMRTSHNVESGETVEGSSSSSSDAVVITHTLPPSIIIAQPEPLPTSTSPKKANGTSGGGAERMERFEEFELRENSITESPPPKSANQPSSSPGSNGFPYDFAAAADAENQLHQQQTQAARTLPTAIIVICMSTVALVMSAVFVGMCVAKRRQIQLLAASSPGGCSRSTSNPSSVVGSSGGDARIQLPPPMPHHQYMLYGPNGGGGTLPRNTLSRRPPPSPLQEDIYGWLYPPPAMMYPPHGYGYDTMSLRRGAGGGTRMCDVQQSSIQMH